MSTINEKEQEIIEKLQDISSTLLSASDLIFGQPDLLTGDKRNLFAKKQEEIAAIESSITAAVNVFDAYLNIDSAEVQNLGLNACIKLVFDLGKSTALLGLAFDSVINEIVELRKSGLTYDSPVLNNLDQIRDLLLSTDNKISGSTDCIMNQVAGLIFEQSSQQGITSTTPGNSTANLSTTTSKSPSDRFF